MQNPHIAILGNARRIYALRFRAEDRTDYGARQTHLADLVGQRYSHNHERADNPENVWALRKIATKDRHVFLSSVLDCLPKPDRLEAERALRRQARMAR